MNPDSATSPCSPGSSFGGRLLNLPVVVLRRLLDLNVLLLRSRLLGTYLRLWCQELRHSPYRQPRSFEARLALKASGQVTDELVYGELPLAMPLWLFSRAGVGHMSTVLDLGAARGRRHEARSAG